MKTFKRITQTLLSVLLVVSLIGCSTKDATKIQENFDSFITQQLVDSMESDYLSTHMGFEHPEAYGIDKSKVNVSLGDDINLDDETYQQLATDQKEVETEFKKFDRQLLTKEQQVTYDIFKVEMNSDARDLNEKYRYLSSLFEEGNGLHVAFTTIFSNFPLRTEKDADDLIVLVADVKRYVDEAIIYTQKQAEKGLMMIDIDGVIEFCQKITDKGMDSSLLRDMKVNIDKMNVSDNQKNDYKSRLETAFKDSFIPAYQAIIDGLNGLKTAKNNTQGYYHLENGKEYYENLVKDAIGADISIKDVKKSLENTADKYLKKYMTVMRNNPDAIEALMNNDSKTKYTDYETMLVDLKNKIETNFPKVTNLDYTINDLDPEVVSSLIAAYFIVPAIDQSTPMNIFVNNTRDTMAIDDLSTFATVAHEGIPGHMYQISYSSENNKVPYRYFQSSNDAYVEGYAKYVEMLSYNYVEGVDKDVINLVVANEVFIYCTLVIADIGIHYEGWTVEQFSKYLTNNGLSVDAEAAKGQYDQLQANPGAFIPYFYGFSQFDKLRSEAESKLGSKFNEKDFHEAILKSGTAPFSVVETNVAEYIKSAK